MAATAVSEKSAFERLAAINVGPHTEKKNGLTYLSWAWAWDQLLRQDPTASYEYLEPKSFGGDTWMVYCAVTAFGVTRTAHLPVMDHRNKAIANPDAFAINTAMQRALVKAIALHGLGLYIYAGEDLPLSETDAAAQPEAAKYEEWVLGLEAAAVEGTAKLLATVKASDEANRNRLRADVKAWHALKTRAEQADKAAA